MKTLNLIAVILLFGLITVSCEGPEGPKGANGTNGIDGTNGTDGNANVMVYGFPGDTISTTNTYISNTLPITSGMTDSSMILPYFSASSLWYQAGQVGPNASYLTRYFIYPNTTSCDVTIRIHNVDGTSYTGADNIWDSVRIFVIPANVFHMAEQNNLDFSNFNEVNGYFKQK